MQSKRFVNTLDLLQKYIVESEFINCRFYLALKTKKFYGHLNKNKKCVLHDATLAFIYIRLC